MPPHPIPPSAPASAAANLLLTKPSLNAPSRIPSPTPSLTLSRRTIAPMMATTVDVEPHVVFGDNMHGGVTRAAPTDVAAPVKHAVVANLVIKRMLPMKINKAVVPVCSNAGWNGWDLMIVTIKTKVIIPAPIEGVGESIKLVQQ